MKVTIFGASSASGRLLVEKALAKGYEVNAFVRNESNLKISNPNLKIICGDALDPAQVENAVKGSDAVLSTLGPKGKPTVMAARSTKNIVDTMEKYGVRRLILVSVAGIAVPEDKRGRNLVSGLIKFLLKDVFTDREQQLAVLESSQVEWVAVRVPRLTDDPATGSVKAVFGNPSPAWKLTRADLADFMLQQLSEDRWLRKAPILSN